MYLKNKSISLVLISNRLLNLISNLKSILINHFYILKLNPVVIPKVAPKDQHIKKIGSTNFLSIQREKINQQKSLHHQG